MASTTLGVNKPAKVHSKDRTMDPVRATSRTNKAPHDKVLKELPRMRALNKEASKTPTRTDSVDQVNRIRQANRTLVLTNKPDQASRTPATTDKTGRTDRTPVTMDKQNQTIKTPRTNNHSNSQQMTVHISLSRRALRNNTPLPTRPATVAIRENLRLRTANKARTKRRVHCIATPTTPTSSVHSNRKTKRTRATMALFSVTQAARRKTSRLPWVITILFTPARRVRSWKTP